MKALVLAGGFPQIELIKKLKARKIVTILADYYNHPVARDYADKFYQVSTLDIDAIKQLAIDEKVDFVITVCTDQAVLTMARVSEELGLPCYIDYETAKNVTNKAYMKKVFEKNGIPSAKYMIVGELDDVDLSNWEFPLIVKPADCNSSKGVCRVDNKEELSVALKEAILLSRTDTAVVEEFIPGKELSVDVYVENGKAIILDVTTSEKLKIKDKFIIFRTWHPADISQEIKNKIDFVTQKIVDSFGIKDSPMLIQLLSNGEEIFVIEFSARTGGGVKHLSIERRTGVDIISAVIDLMTGVKPKITIGEPLTRLMVDEYIYCRPGVYDHVEGFEDLKNNGIISDYYIFRWNESVFDKVENSGDRIGGFTIEGDTIEELQKKHNLVNRTVRVMSILNEDIMYHDLLADFDTLEA